MDYQRNGLLDGMDGVVPEEQGPYFQEIQIHLV